MRDYNWKSDCWNDFITVELHGKFGFIDKSEKEICEIKYDSVGYFFGGFAYVEINRKYGYINDNGIEVIHCEYDYGEVHIQLKKYKLNQLRLSKLDKIL